MDASGSAEPQPILSPLTEAAMFLVLTVSPGHEDEVRDLLADVSGPGPVRRFPQPKWRPLLHRRPGLAALGPAFRCPPPRRLAPVRGAERPTAHCGVHPGDILLHIRAHRFDLCFELAQRLLTRLEGLTPGSSTRCTVPGSFRRARPPRLRRRHRKPLREGVPVVAASFIDDDDPAFAGGQLRAGAEVSPRPRRLGRAFECGRPGTGYRAAPSSPTSRCPTTSSRATPMSPSTPSSSTPSGEERQIRRASTCPSEGSAPGSSGTHPGSATPPTPEIIEQMLTNMFVGKPPGNYRPCMGLLAGRHRQSVLRAHRRLPR